MTAVVSRSVFRALGTTATVLTGVGSHDATPVGADDGHARALAEVRSVLQAIDRTCSRFRPDSDLERVNRAKGRPQQVDPLLLDAVEVALDAARWTGGVVDPTVGAAIVMLGYDRSFTDLVANDDPPVSVRTAGLWQMVAIDRAAGTLAVPLGVRLDLGATAKAYAADLAAAAAARVSGCPVMVNLGGDLSIAGPSLEGGWSILVSDAHDADLDHPPTGSTSIELDQGALATSSTSVRRWIRQGGQHHHIVDPATGRSAVGPLRTVSVVATRCVDANAASTAAIVLGDRAEDWLRDLGLPTRIVRIDGTVITLGGWPAEDAP